MRHVSRTHRVALDWLFDKINLDPKIQIKYIDTKNQLADILTKGNFTRDEWKHLLCLFNISHFSSTNCSEVMSKRTQKDAGEERVTAKSKPMMNLVSRCRERDPNVLASTASESPGKTKSESQLPLSSWNEQQPRTWRLVMGASSSDYSEWNIDEQWSSQEWKSDEMLEVRTGRPVGRQPAGVLSPSTQTSLSLMTMICDSDTVTESDLSFESRSFLHRVNERLRKISDHSSKDAMQDSNKHSKMENVYVFNITSICFHGKELLGKFTFHQNTVNNLILKQMFDISEKLIVGQSDEIFGVKTIYREDSSWKQLSLVGDEEVISLSHAKVYVFSDSVLCLGNVNQNPASKTVWEDKLTWFKSSSQYRASNKIDGEPMEFEWNIFPGFTTLQLCHKVQDLLLRWSVTPENLRDGSSSCRCSTTSHEDLQTMNRNAN